MSSSELSVEPPSGSLLDLRSALPACPGLFYATPSRDGFLLRLRVPGGILNTAQVQVLADIADRYSHGQVHITNRANLQLRTTVSPTAADLQRLQTVGLAASNPRLDHLRNLMASPTAGIDPQALIDVRPLIQAIATQISQTDAFADLPAKFSIGLDGGEQLSIADRPNDLRFLAVRTPNGSPAFHLYLPAPDGTPSPSGLVIPPNQVVDSVVAIAHRYLNYLHTIPPADRKQFRFKHLPIGWATEWAKPTHPPIHPSTHPPIHPLPHPNSPRFHGPFPQRQPDRHALGLVIPLGQIRSTQLRGLAALVEQWSEPQDNPAGDRTLRLTPWQTLFLTDIPTTHLPQVQAAVEALDLHWSPTQISAGLVACTGSTGCTAAHTDTQADAIALTLTLTQRLQLDRPLTIHLSGCDKSCAHHGPSDITCIAHAPNTYTLYTNTPTTNAPFGQPQHTTLTAAQLPEIITRLVSPTPSPPHNK